MKLKSKPIKFIIWTFFLVYLALLVKVIIFKYPRGIMAFFMKCRHEIPWGQRIASCNFIPLKTILYYLGGNQSIAIAKANLLGNIIAFSPLGFLLPLILTKVDSMKNVAIISSVVSLSFEVIQLATNLGQFDIDDIILNVLGAILGFAVYKAMKNIICKNINIHFE